MAQESGIDWKREKLAKVGLAQRQLEVLQLLGDRLDLLDDAVDLLDDLAVEPLRHRPLLQGQVAEVEEADRLLDQLLGIVVILAQRVAVDALVDVHQLLDRRRQLFGSGQLLLEVGGEPLGIGVEHIGHQHRVVGDRCPARLGDDVRALHPGIVADVLDLVDDVVGVLVDGVVDAGEVARLGAVVIDAESAADIHILDPDAELAQLGIDPRPLDQGGLDLVDLGDLAADMEMEQLHLVDQAVLLQQIDGGDDLRHPQAELGILAAGGGPLAGPLGGELDPDAEFWLDAGFLHQLDHLLQLEQLFDDQGDVVADLGGVEHRLDILGILVAVADDRQVVAAGDGDAGHQFRLGADLKADIVAFAVLGDRLHHLALLVHLDGIEGLVLGRVLVLGNGALEDPVDAGNPPLEDVHEAEQNRRLDLPLDQVVHQRAQIDGAVGTGRRVNADVPFLVDGEKVGTPVVEVVDFGGVVDGPAFGYHR